MTVSKEKIEVEILDVREIVTYPQPNKPFVTHVITYRYADQPPSTVFIPAQEDTPEKRAKIIREDIEKNRARKPEKLTV